MLLLIDTISTFLPVLLSQQQVAIDLHIILLFLKSGSQQGKLPFGREKSHMMNQAAVLMRIRTERRKARDTETVDNHRRRKPC